MLRSTATRSLLLAGLVLSACGPDAVPVPDWAVESKIPDASVLAYRVYHDAPDHLALEVQVRYRGGADGVVLAGAATRQHGKSTGEWAYRPSVVREGESWVPVYLGLNDSAPAVSFSDELVLTLYVGGGSNLVRATVPYRKTWRLFPTSGCHQQWGDGCGAGCDG